MTKLFEEMMAAPIAGGAISDDARRYGAALAAFMNACYELTAATRQLDEIASLQGALAHAPSAFEEARRMLRELLTDVPAMRAVLTVPQNEG